VRKWAAARRAAAEATEALAAAEAAHRRAAAEAARLQLHPALRDEWQRLRRPP
jgi:hypothetical protein